MDESTLSRRNLLKTAGIAGAAVGLSGLAAAVEMTPEGRWETITPERANPTMIGVPFEKHETVRLGIIGVGGRGTGVCSEFLAVPGVEIKAVCDVVPSKTANAASMVEK